MVKKVPRESGESTNKQFNRVKGALSDAGVTGTVLALFLDIHEGTVSSWNRNSKQPSLAEIDRAAEFLEIDNHDFIINTSRKNTGLAKAVMAEYKRLMDDGVSLYVKVPDEKKGKLKRVFNPELVKALHKFSEQYKNKKK